LKQSLLDCFDKRNDRSTLEDDYTCKSTLVIKAYEGPGYDECEHIRKQNVNGAI